jgi:hypothetical protein
MLAMGAVVGTPDVHHSKKVTPPIAPGGVTMFPWPKTDNPAEWLVQALAGFIERALPGRIGKAMKWILGAVFLMAWAAIVIIEIASSFG